MQTYLFANHHKVFVVLNLVLASTAFVVTNTKTRYASCEMYRVFENCPLEHDPKHFPFLFSKKIKKTTPPKRNVLEGFLLKRINLE